ncbi:cytochrome d ubiquinol oxidase subunit II [Caldalkalibacillus thermarum TA2.A1]|uniref:Cytochrome d ubiquinol oxidase subunit II n=1 Tax=Caldalkalibacillus thermarum (strain TA2.A1) TaxID=986075 RepID=F5L8J4_CALTT|nr:cytochrome d ubiquinol oxidase subunit II [Caldalkalibacillus thermarum]EGL82333.1 cytochrome d ubiquinol oxidase subunit II [Caldalkalibacillus thermarum TA2.A1]QZT32896.1 cytochrome d ubiquinol oxidase subunit II [Caldalkalibacillus thermarum TA2.A1]GGK27058.1 cytochrome D ubiquinol oxidase subunit II [Caldalkalibacillus thermarum]
MDYEVIGMTVLWTFLFGYVIVASIDFGAGFFNAYSLWTGQHQVLSNVIQRYLSPVWEVTNVFLIFFFVGMIGFFPSTAYYYGSALLIPLSISIILLAIRGSYYAFETYGSKGHRGYAFLYGATGLVLPASLSVVFTISEGGFIQLTERGPVLDYWTLFTSPLSWSIVVLAVAAVLYISAVFLTWYADRGGHSQATALFRRYALIWALPTIVTAMGIVYELRNHNPDHFASLLNLWWMFAISLLFFVASVWLIWQKKYYGTAFLLLVGQFAFAFYAYGISKYPYLLYPYLTVYDGATNEAMAIALIVAFVAGLCLLVPSLYLLLRFFVLDDQYVAGKK